MTYERLLNNMKKLLLTLLLIITGCAPAREYVSLPTFPETEKDYRYFIRVPPDTHSVSIFWYYGKEARENLIYASGLVNLRTQVIETDMHFAYPGRYILVYYYQSPHTLRKERKIYNAGASY